MADLPERDAALLLDMLLAARDARSFIRGLDEVIVGMRHRLIHGYGDVRLDLIWKVAHEHLAPLIASLVNIVPNSGENGR
jgi:uncharacterized protein with HEPN domain